MADPQGSQDPADPQCGQLCAAVEISRPHSGHAIKLIEELRDGGVIGLSGVPADGGRAVRTSAPSGGRSTGSGEEAIGVRALARVRFRPAKASASGGRAFTQSDSGMMMTGGVSVCPPATALFRSSAASIFVPNPASFHAGVEAMPTTR